MGIISGTVLHQNLLNGENLVRASLLSVEPDAKDAVAILNLPGCCLGMLFFKHEAGMRDRRIAVNKKSGLLWTGYINDIESLYQRLTKSGYDMERGAGEAQILLESYFKFGIESLQGLNGLYSIVIWDNEQKSFLTVTDRYGFTKIYYWLSTNELVFASECKAIINHPNFRKTIDIEGLTNFLGAGYCFGENTLFKGIKLIPQGSVLTYKDKKVSFKKYWDYVVKPANGTLDEFLEKFLHTLNSAFSRSMNGKKSVFIPLSGGFDSRAMAGLSVYHGLETFTCTLGRQGSRDYRYGTMIGKKLNTHHTKLDIQSDYIMKYSPKGVLLTDGQVICHPFYIMRIFDYQKTQDSLNTLISGIGGGELIGVMRHGNIKKIDGVPLVQLHISQRFLRAFGDDELHGILVRGLHSAIKQNYIYVQQKIDDAYAEDLIDKIWVTLVSERVRHFNSNILLSAMGYRWNVYAPFMDNHFVDFMLTVPRGLTDANQKLFRRFFIKFFPELASIPTDKTGKKIKQSWFRDGISWRWEHLKGKISHSIGQQCSQLDKLKYHPLAQRIGIGKNRNWLVDADEAIRTGSAPYFRELFSDRDRMADIFNIDFVDKLFDSHLKRHTNAYQKICAIATIIEWRRQFGI